MVLSCLQTLLVCVLLCQLLAYFLFKETKHMAAPALL